MPKPTALGMNQHEWRFQAEGFAFVRFELDVCNVGPRRRSARLSGPTADARVEDFADENMDTTNQQRTRGSASKAAALAVKTEVGQEEDSQTNVKAMRSLWEQRALVKPGASGRYCAVYCQRHHLDADAWDGLG